MTTCGCPGVCGKRYDGSITLRASAVQRKFRQQRSVDIRCSALKIETRKIVRPRRLIMCNKSFNKVSSTTVIATEASFQVVPRQAVATYLMPDPWASNSKLRIAQGVYAKRKILKYNGDHFDKAWHPMQRFGWAYSSVDSGGSSLPAD